jgi:hypothetical protein
MNAMLEPRMTAARIQGFDLGWHGAADGADCISASSHGDFMHCRCSERGGRLLSTQFLLHQLFNAAQNFVFAHSRRVKNYGVFGGSER